MTELVASAFRRSDDPLILKRNGAGSAPADAFEPLVEDDISRSLANENDEVSIDEEEVDDTYFDSEDNGGEGEGDSRPTTWDFPRADADEATMEMEDELLHRLGEADRIPLYASATVSLLGALLVILTICKAHGVPNTCVDELLRALSNEILPQPNCLPKTERQATKLLRALGLGYTVIHACLKGCILFRGPYALLNRCPKCLTPRFYRRGKDKKPVKVVRHFPITPRLKRMYGTEYLSKMMTWWAENPSEDGLMRNPADAPAWKHVDAMYPDFGGEARNPRLLISTDGLNPFSFKSSSWSIWPVLIIILNLPPWLMCKKFFILLTLLIPGPHAPSSKTFDVYFAPVIEELKDLWNPGVWVDDAMTRGNASGFLMRVVCLYTVTNFPGLGLISGCATKGYVACPHCGPATCGRYSTHLRKTVYDGQHRKWLNVLHNFRHGGEAFNFVPEWRTAPPRVTLAQVLEWADARERFMVDGTRPMREDPARVTGIKRRSALYDLPYWEVRCTAWNLEIYL